MFVNIDQKWEKFFKHPKQITYTPPGILVMKYKFQFHWTNILAITTNVNFGRLTASARPLFRAPRPGYEKTTISIELKYHSTQKASYRIKRGFIHILSGHLLELIATGIFYGFLNIYKILRLLREQNIVRFQRPKITSNT